MTAGTSGSVGTLTLVLHAHLPWVAHHGTWPVGEEWLHQAWAGSWAPLLAALERLGEEGARDLLSLGVTPVLAAQLDDPWCVGEHERWLGLWRLRAEGLAARRDPVLADVAAEQFAAASSALDRHASAWASGASPLLRRLADAGVVEVLGGPLTHPVLPLLDPDVAALALTAGLDDAAVRLGHRPRGIWLPECAHAPELEDVLGAAGVGHLPLDEPSVVGAGGTTADPWLLGDSDVVVLARDLAVTDRVWSARTGYPAGASYRDFHAWDSDSGLRAYRVTGLEVPAADKLPYDAAAARASVRRDAEDFVSFVRSRLLALRSARDGRPATLAAAWDAELFGHHWHEGVEFLETVLRLLPQAGVRLASMATVAAEVTPAGRIRSGTGSWGQGKDLRLWAGEQVHDVLGRQREAVARLRATVAALTDPRRRDPVLDQLARSALLALSSDWAFMVSRDAAADYGRARAHGHAEDVEALATLLGEGDRGAAVALADRLRARDGVPGTLDARRL